MSENDARGLKVSYFGPALPDVDEGIPCGYVTPPALRPAVPNQVALRDGDLLAVSATHLVGLGGMASVDAFKFLADYRPLARVGYSILIYRLTDEYLVRR